MYCYWALPEYDKIYLKKITRKLAILIIIPSGQRYQTIYALYIAENCRMMHIFHRYIPSLEYI